MRGMAAISLSPVCLRGEPRFASRAGLGFSHISFPLAGGGLWWGKQELWEDRR